MSSSLARRGTAAILAAAVLAACSSAPTTSPTDAPGPDSTPTSAASSVASATSGASQPTAAPSEPAEPAWLQLADDVAEVGPREDHTWTLTPDGATGYLFGGRRGDGSALGDLWAYDLASGSWDAVGAAGPAARFGHNAEWVDGVGLVVFAGQAGSDFFNDLWAFDPAAGVWRQLPSGGDVPVARYGSCAAIGPDGRLWISHGFTADGRRFADTRAYDFNAGTWFDETPSGDVPIARCLHACWWTDARELALYAGQTTGITALGDLWHLAIGPRQGTHAWARLPFDGGTPPPDRNLYASVRVDGGTLVVGGLGLEGYLSDAWLITDDGTAEPLGPTGTMPTGRSGGELIYDEGRGRVLLFGGRNGQDAMSDLWELRL